MMGSGVRIPLAAHQIADYFLGFRRRHIAEWSARSFGGHAGDTKFRARFFGTLERQVQRSSLANLSSNMSMLMMLRRMGRGDLTTHGFRSTFRDWAAERTNFPSEVAEAALAHVIGDRTEAAYRRGDLFEKRRRLMDAWAAHCQRASGRISICNSTKAPPTYK
jgi:integrase